MYKYNDLVKLFDVKNFKYGLEYFYILVLKLIEDLIKYIVKIDKWSHECNLAKKLIWTTLIATLLYFINFKNCMTYVLIWLMADIFRLIGKNTMPLISAFLAMYAVFYNTLNRNYSAREAAIINITNKATEQIRELKDATIARKVTNTELLKKPNYLKIYDILTYESQVNDKIDKVLDVDFDFLEKDLKIKIDEKVVNISKYKNHLGEADWIKVYEDVNRNGIALNMIKDYIEGMKKRGFVNQKQHLFIQTEIEKTINHPDYFSLNQRLNILKYKLTSENYIIKPDFKDLWLHGIDLSKANLHTADIWRTSLQNADISKTRLKLAKFWQANLQGADFSGNHMEGVTISLSNLTGVDMLDANLTGSKLYKNQFNGTDLSDANISKSKLWSSRFLASNLTRANLEYSDISKVKFLLYKDNNMILHNNISYANFTNSFVSETEKPKPVFLKKAFLDANYHSIVPDFSGIKGIETACFDEGVKEIIINKFNLKVDKNMIEIGERRCKSLYQVSTIAIKDFSNRNLSNFTLKNIDFIGANLTNSTFFNIKLKKARFLSDANGNKTNISNSNFINILSSKSSGYENILTILKDSSYTSVRPDFSGIKGIETACFDEGVKEEIIKQFQLNVENQNLMIKNESRCRLIRAKLRNSI